MVTKKTDLSLRELFRQHKLTLIEDESVHAFLEPEIKDKDQRREFIKRCLNRQGTLRMLNRARWYTEIADRMSEIRPGRPALQIVFLMSLSEGVAKLKVRNKNLNAKDAIKEFFSHTMIEDRYFLINNFQRSAVSRSRFRFDSIISILYTIRSRAIHGDDFYSFTLLDERQKREHSRECNSFGLITVSKKGKPGRQKNVTLDITMTYPELRNIVRRTAIENIKSWFK